MMMKMSIRNITDTATNDLLGGLCPQCYRILSECKCSETKPITEVNRSGMRNRENGVMK